MCIRDRVQADTWGGSDSAAVPVTAMASLYDRSIIAGNINQNIRGVPAIDVPVAAPKIANQVALKCQNNANKQKNDKDQTGRIHGHHIISVGKARRQLSYLFLNRVWIDKHSDCKVFRAKSKIW